MSESRTVNRLALKSELNRTPIHAEPGQEQDHRRALDEELIFFLQSTGFELARDVP